MDQFIIACNSAMLNTSEPDNLFHMLIFIAENKFWNPCFCTCSKINLSRINFGKEHI